MATGTRKGKATPSRRVKDSSVATLKTQLAKRDQTIAELTRQLTEMSQNLARLTEQLAEFQRLLFGRRSEKLPSMATQVRRVVEEHELTVDGEAMPSEPKARKREQLRHRRKKSEAVRKVRRTIKKSLPVVHERVNVRPEQLPPGTRFEDYRVVQSGETVRRIEHVREHLVVVEYALQTLASKDGQSIIKATAPLGVNEGGSYGPGLHAHVVVAKCADSIPFHRLGRMLGRAGAPLARSTLCTLFHRVGEMLEPIYMLLMDEARRDPYLHADETTLLVQAEAQCRIGWIWGLMSARVIAYTFADSRSGAVAKKLIGESQGYLTVDGYSGYNEFDEGNGKRIRVGCWAHCRRKFFEALKSEPRALEVLELICSLYVIERRAVLEGVAGTQEHLRRRQTDSLAVVESIEQWVDDEQGKHSPKSAMGKALGYAVKQRLRLRRFMQDAKLALDNNYAERNLRIIAVGRKNFLFAGSDACAQHLAILQTIVSTCLLNSVNPYEYIKDVLIRVQQHKHRHLPELLPWNWKPPEVLSAAGHILAA